MYYFVLAIAMFDPLALKKNRYADALRNDDFTINQDWDSYSESEHDRWNRLYDRQKQHLPGRACEHFISAMEALELSTAGIPDMEKLSNRLEAITGWRVVPVAGLVPDEIFYEHLANRRFPAGAFIRPEAEFDYLEEPDIFHDIFGHVPMLANPVYAEFVEAYGRGGQKALQRGQLHNLARLYWYTVEFGLVKTTDGLRIFGAGILSSPQESVFSLEDSSPNRIEFDLVRVMQTDFMIDDFQKTYFVIESFEDLLEQCYQNFDVIYDALANLPNAQPHEVLEADRILHRGDQEYFDNQRPKKPLY